VNYLAKLVLVSSRSVNSLVWALLFVAIFGPGRWRHARHRVPLDRLRGKALR
jgi:ABC-type phosphate/phosphonate transport system permease subunit